MIIGPNGTGKSTLVCAIALGLGYSPGVLDRAPHLKLYIKHGAEQGSIEIELKGHRGKKNSIIKLYLNNSTNNRLFEVDGYQVGVFYKNNFLKHSYYSCFLPQEKVSKFAEMKEPELLKETQKVAGHPKLSEWHQLLIIEGQKKIEIIAKVNYHQKKFNELEKQSQGMRADVDRLAARKVFEKKVKIYFFILEDMRYKMHQEAHNEAKQRCNDIAKELREHEEALRPMEAQQEIFGSLKDQYQKLSNQLSKTIENHRSSLKSLEPKLNLMNTKLNDASEKLSTLKEDERRQRDLRVRLTQQVQELAELIKENVEEPDLTVFDEEIIFYISLFVFTSSAKQKSLTGQMREIQRDTSSLKDRQMELYRDRDNLVAQQNDLHKEINGLRSVSHRQEADIKQYSPNLFKALQVMRELQQRGRFRAKVYEPIRLVISPKKPDFAQAVEGCMSMDLMNTFLCTNPDDYELMASELNDTLKLRVNIACLAAGDSLSNYPPPVSLDEIKRLGFDDYVINLVDGPDQVLAFICQQNRLNLVPICHTQGAKVSESVLEDKTFPIKNWIIGSARFSINYSSYGSRERITKSFEISRPKILNLGAVDEKLIEEKTKALKSLDETSAAKQEKVTELKAEEAKLRKGHEELQERKREVENQKKSAEKAHLQFLKNKKNHKKKVEELKLENAKPTLQQERQKRKDAFKQAAQDAHEVFKKFKAKYCQISQSSTALVSLSLLMFQHETDYKSFKEQYQNKKEGLTDIKQRLEDGKELKASSEHQDRTIQDMESLYQHEKDELDLLHPVDPGIIARYNSLQQNMKDEKAQLDIHEGDAEKVEKKIKKVYDLWRPQLDDLIRNVDEKFDSAFKRMGCLGHVTIVEDPDYDKWGIEIQVSFRDNNPLVRLDAHRQSGGERSLSTIMYLMSLTELGKAPFSLVDEINQGMDRDYERAVHDQLVEITCKNDASQYFLITPKLLLGLRYHPMMRVLCVNNGDWLPQGFKLGPSLTLAKKRKMEERRSLVQPIR
ncbi:hypothetical protein BY996DRAFT_6432043 [Phakopsora pachyrhizi]|nr:hypothetical protein BY996DRAFT_6432043 [Phakopsora pachyrhizi]